MGTSPDSRSAYEIKLQLLYDEQAHLLERKGIHQYNLQEKLRQEALYGINVPLDIKNEVTLQKTRIREIDQELARINREIAEVIRGSAALAPREADFLARLAGEGQTIFTAKQAQRFWGNTAYTANVLGRLESKGWLRRLERGTYMIVPFEAGPARNWTESALVIAPHLIQPAAIAYWSALFYWNMTEQVPRTVFVQSTRRKHWRRKEVLGVPFRFVTVVESKFFGVAKRTLNGQPIYVTDREKTLLDAADRPDLSGGIGQLAQALRTSCADVNWQRLDEYLVRFGTGSVTKRLGYLVDTLDLPLPDREERLAHWHRSLTSGIALLEPGQDNTGRIVTRWRLRVNIEETWRDREIGQ